MSGGVAAAAWGFVPFLAGVSAGAVLGRFVVPAFSYWTGVEETGAEARRSDGGTSSPELP